MNNQNKIFEKMIIIDKTDKCDTRTNPKGFTIADVESDTLKHIKAVNLCGEFLCSKIESQFKEHDRTKLGEYLPAFYEALKSGFKGKEFKGQDWFKIHVESERHHLNDHVPDDVNLIDVIEMICDGVCAGKARTGSVYPMKISADVLEKAVANTQKLLEDSIKVKGDGK